MSTIHGTHRPSHTFSAGTHETYTLVPTVTSTDHLTPLALHPHEVDEYVADGWTVTWRISC